MLKSGIGLDNYKGKVSDEFKIDDWTGYPDGLLKPEGHIGY